MLKVYIGVPSEMSLAMHRTKRGLSSAAPRWVEFVKTAEEADLQVLHVIGCDGLDELKCDRYAVLQYCYRTTEWGSDPEAWAGLWRGADLVWSYYDLSRDVPRETSFLHSPLGVDSGFLGGAYGKRSVGIMTSGYVSGIDEAEAIEEVAIAAARVGLSVVHLGPDKIDGMERPKGQWEAVSNITDNVLRDLYGQSLWVSGLRHVEGFELPVIEGLLNGARPIVFDRPETRFWFDGFAEFVPECSGDRLIELLAEILSRPPRPVSALERGRVLDRFNWNAISGRFWSELLAVQAKGSNSLSKARSLDGGGIALAEGSGSLLDSATARGGTIPARERVGVAR